MENDPYDFSNACRTCLSRDRSMKYLFAVHISDTELVRVVDFIRRMSSLKMTKDDGLPDHMCVCCIETLCKSYAFVQQCISSDNRLREVRLHRKRVALQNIQNEIFGDSDKEELELQESQDDCDAQDITTKVTESEPNQNKVSCSEFESESKSRTSIKSNDIKICKNVDQCFESKNDELIIVEENGKVEFDGLIFDNFEIVQEQAEVVNEEVKIEKPDEENVFKQNYKKIRNSYQLKFQCEECHESFKSKIKLEKHEVLHDSTRPYRCFECMKTFSKKRHLSVHMRSHKGVEEKQHVCTVCNQKFMYEYLLKQHSFKHTEEKPYPCSVCKRGCLTAESLRRHMKTHEENYKKKNHVCSVCSKEFPYPSFLAEHMKNHTGEKPFLCSICGRGFRQSGALEYHIRSHTGFKPYTCEICKNKFTSRGVLRVHMRRHTNERPYVCDVCGMAFRQSTDMKSHRRTHTGDKRALCTICGKRMSTTGQLTVHLRSHTGEKPYGCDVCLKAFTTRTMLVKHRRIHTGELPYVCNICGRAFNQSSTLKTHGTIHFKNRVVKNPSHHSTNVVSQKVIIFEMKDENPTINCEVPEKTEAVENSDVTVLPAPIPTV